EYDGDVCFVDLGVLYNPLCGGNTEAKHKAVRQSPTSLENNLNRNIIVLFYV
ncbi:unnamed protein product, partial [Rotaria sordida]